MDEKTRTAIPRIRGKHPKDAGKSYKALPQAGAEVSLEEIRDVLQDDGYSANQRKAWLKEVLTELQDGRVKPQSRDRDALVDAIKEIVADYQNTKPMSDDIL